MTPLIVVAIVVGVAGVALGAYLKICSTISREDRTGSVRFDAVSASARSARALIGLGGSKWED